MNTRPNTFDDVLTPKFAGGVIRKLTRRTGTPLYDDDLIQDALLRGLLAFRRIPQIRAPYALFTKIAQDTVIDHWRRRSVPTEEIMPGQDKVQPTVDDDIDRQRQYARLGRALSLLARQDREIVEMFYLREVPIAEIAETFHRSRSAIKMTLLRSRRTLQRLLNI